MRIAIHQPNFLPWIGFFYKVSHCDIFVLLDHVQYSKGEYTNRVAIKNQQERLWLTVPVLTKGKGLQPICEVKINQEKNWKRKHLRTLRQCYQKAPFFREIYPVIEDIYNYGTPYLSEFNIHIIRTVMRSLDIATPLLVSSDLHVTGFKNELLIGIIKKVGGNEYLSGSGALAYNEEFFFQDRGIKLDYGDFVHPHYKQVCGETFIEGLSIVDYLFNCGFENKNFLPVPNGNLLS